MDIQGLLAAAWEMGRQQREEGKGGGKKGKKKGGKNWGGGNGWNWGGGNAWSEGDNGWDEWGGYDQAWGEKGGRNQYQMGGGWRNGATTVGGPGHGGPIPGVRLVADLRTPGSGGVSGGVGAGVNANVGGGTNNVGMNNGGGNGGVTNEVSMSDGAGSSASMSSGVNGVGVNNGGGNGGMGNAGGGNGGASRDVVYNANMSSGDIDVGVNNGRGNMAYNMNMGGGMYGGGLGSGGVGGGVTYNANTSGGMEQNMINNVSTSGGATSSGTLNVGTNDVANNGFVDTYLNNAIQPSGIGGSYSILGGQSMGQGGVIGTMGAVANQGEGIDVGMGGGVLPGATHAQSSFVVGGEAKRSSSVDDKMEVKVVKRAAPVWEVDMADEEGHSFAKFAKPGGDATEGCYFVEMPDGKRRLVYRVWLEEHKMRMRMRWESIEAFCEQSDLSPMAVRQKVTLSEVGDIWDDFLVGRRPELETQGGVEAFEDAREVSSAVDDNVGSSARNSMNVPASRSGSALIGQSGGKASGGGGTHGCGGGAVLNNANEGNTSGGVSDAIVSKGDDASVGGNVGIESSVGNSAGRQVSVEDAVEEAKAGGDSIAVEVDVEQLQEYQWGCWGSKGEEEALKLLSGQYIGLLGKSGVYHVKDGKDTLGKDGSLGLKGLKTSIRGNSGTGKIATGNIPIRPGHSFVCYAKKEIVRSRSDLAELRRKGGEETAMWKRWVWEGCRTAADMLRWEASLWTRWKVEKDRFGRWPLCGKLGLEANKFHECSVRNIIVVICAPIRYPWSTLKTEDNAKNVCKDDGDLEWGVEYVYAAEGFSDSFLNTYVRGGGGRRTLIVEDERVVAKNVSAQMGTPRNCPVEEVWYEKVKANVILMYSVVPSFAAQVLKAVEGGTRREDVVLRSVMDGVAGITVWNCHYNEAVAGWQGWMNPVIVGARSENIATYNRDAVVRGAACEFRGEVYREWEHPRRLWSNNETSMYESWTNRTIPFGGYMLKNVDRGGVDNMAWDNAKKRVVCEGSDCGFFDVGSTFDEDMITRHGQWYSGSFIDAKMDRPTEGSVTYKEMGVGSHLYCYNNKGENGLREARWREGAPENEWLANIFVHSRKLENVGLNPGETTAGIEVKWQVGGLFEAKNTGTGVKGTGESEVDAKNNLASKEGGNGKMHAARVILDNVKFLETRGRLRDFSANNWGGGGDFRKGRGNEKGGDSERDTHRSRTAGASGSNAKGNVGKRSTSVVVQALGKGKSSVGGGVPGVMQAVNFIPRPGQGHQFGGEKKPTGSTKAYIDFKGKGGKGVPEGLKDGMNAWPSLGQDLVDKMGAWPVEGSGGATSSGTLNVGRVEGVNATVQATKQEDVKEEGEHESSSGSNDGILSILDDIGLGGATEESEGKSDDIDKDGDVAMRGKSVGREDKDGDVTMRGKSIGRSEGHVEVELNEKEIAWLEAKRKKEEVDAEGDLLMGRKSLGAKSAGDVEVGKEADSIATLEQKKEEKEVELITTMEHEKEEKQAELVTILSRQKEGEKVAVVVSPKGSNDWVRKAKMSGRDARGKSIMRVDGGAMKDLVGLTRMRDDGEIRGGWKSLVVEYAWGIGPQREIGYSHAEKFVARRLGRFVDERFGRLIGMAIRDNTKRGEFFATKSKKCLIPIHDLAGMLRTWCPKLRKGKDRNRVVDVHRSKGADQVFNRFSVIDGRPQRNTCSRQWEYPGSIVSAINLLALEEEAWKKFRLGDEGGGNIKGFYEELLGAGYLEWELTRDTSRLVGQVRWVHKRPNGDRELRQNCLVCDHVHPKNKKKAKSVYFYKVEGEQAKNKWTGKAINREYSGRGRWDEEEWRQQQWGGNFRGHAVLDWESEEGNMGAASVYPDTLENANYRDDYCGDWSQKSWNEDPRRWALEPYCTNTNHSRVWDGWMEGLFGEKRDVKEARMYHINEMLDGRLRSLNKFIEANSDHIVEQDVDPGLDIQRMMEYVLIQAGVGEVRPGDVAPWDPKRRLLEVAKKTVGWEEVFCRSTNEKRLDEWWDDFMMMDSDRDPLELEGLLQDRVLERFEFEQEMMAGRSQAGGLGVVEANMKKVVVVAANEGGSSGSRAKKDSPKVKEDSSKVGGNLVNVDASKKDDVVDDDELDFGDTPFGTEEESPVSVGTVDDESDDDFLDSKATVNAKKRKEAKERAKAKPKAKGKPTILSMRGSGRR